ncbi:DUF3000 domain-containing protein [Cutibacterium sp. WCA-380-WT-3A]|uniref:DUF3000 domain-containing protein n=1 Tax=Cutibacterium porci TaxID=2605781 RepID=A0A7K0J756_9ACTN|nr:DUF3000 domain-containing protein [Cutibacterium porci]MSS45588.1 DUF3000 domain-containing protein [Cutibacterium porci]
MYPVAFDELRSRILDYSWSDKLEVREIPAPTRVSPFSVAIEGSVSIRGDELGSGRLILLHNPSGSDAWEGTSRFVAMIRADVDPSMASDPLVGHVAWSWLTDSLTSHCAVFHAEAGTVTSVVSRPFGRLAADPESNHIELRASWTPVLSATEDVDSHLASWSDLCLLSCGISPAPDEIATIPPRRAKLA